MNMSAQAAIIYKKLTNLEQQVQRLKVQAYLNLPKKQQTISIYPESNIETSARAIRNQIWQKKYAKKIKSLSWYQRDFSRAEFSDRGSGNYPNSGRVFKKIHVKIAYLSILVTRVTLVKPYTVLEKWGVIS